MQKEKGTYSSIERNRNSPAENLIDLLTENELTLNWITFVDIGLDEKLLLHTATILYMQISIYDNGSFMSIKNFANGPTTYDSPNTYLKI